MYYPDRLPLQIVGRTRLIFQDAGVEKTSTRRYKFVFSGSTGVALRDHPDPKAKQLRVVKNGDEVEVSGEVDRYFQLAENKVQCRVVQYL
jgi:hypothetical protein